MNKKSINGFILLINFLIIFLNTSPKFIIAEISSSSPIETQSSVQLTSGTVTAESQSQITPTAPGQVDSVNSIINPPALNQTLIANMANLIFTPISIAYKLRIPDLDNSSTPKLRASDADFLKNFTNRGLAVFQGQLGFDDKSNNIFYFVSTNIQDEYSLICRMIDSRNDSVKYAYVIQESTNNNFVVSSNFVEKTETGFSQSPPNEKIATFQVLKNNTSFFLKKGKAFLTPEDITGETGFFVMDKVLNNKGLFVDKDIEYSTYKGFDQSFNKAAFLIENLADKNTLISKMISPDKLEMKTIEDLTEAIQFAVELAVIENMRTLLNEIIMELEKYFLRNGQLISNFKTKVDLFFQIKESATDKVGILEDLFNNLQQNINASSSWNVNLTEKEQEIINLLKKELVDLPKASAALIQSSAEEAARAESMLKRVSTATTLDSFATIIKELSDASKWFSEAPGKTDLAPDENKIKTSSDQLISNLTTLLLNIDLKLKELKKITAAPSGKIQDTDAKSLSELNKRLGLFFSTICWQLFFNNGYLALDLVGNFNKLATKTLSVKSLTELNFADLGKLSIAQSTERTFQDPILLSNIKNIFYSAVQQFSATNDLLTIYDKQKAPTVKKTVVITPKKVMAPRPVFQLDTSSSNIVIG